MHNQARYHAQGPNQFDARGSQEKRQAKIASRALSRAIAGISGSRL